MCIYCFFPLCSPVDPETAADAPVIDYVIDDTSTPFQRSFQASPPPLIIPIPLIPISKACIRFFCCN